jgi:hypothetical protein
MGDCLSFDVDVEDAVDLSSMSSMLPHPFGDLSFGAEVMEDADISSFIQTLISFS